MNFLNLCIIIAFIVLTFRVDAQTQNIRGIGSNFPKGTYNSFRFGYSVVRDDLTLSYDGVASGTGVSAYTTKNSEYNYAAVESTQAIKGYDDLVTIPAMIGPIEVAFNLPGLETITLNGTVLAQIFLGNITTWNDSYIQQLNPTLTMPSAPIEKVVREASSSLTYAFTTALSLFDQEFNSIIGRSRLPDWNLGGTNGTSNLALVSIVAQTPYSITYCSKETARSLDVNVIKMVNANGNVVTSSEKAIQSATKERYDATTKGSTKDPDIVLSNTQAPDGWPMLTFTYFVLHNTSQTDCTNGLDVLNYFWWIFFDKGARDEAVAHSFSPMPDNVRDSALTDLSRIQCNGKPLISYSTSFDSFITSTSIVIAVLGVGIHSIQIVNNSSTEYHVKIMRFLSAIGYGGLCISALLFTGNPSVGGCRIQVALPLIVTLLAFSFPVMVLTKWYKVFYPKKLSESTTYTNGLKVYYPSLYMFLGIVMFLGFIYGLIWLLVADPVPTNTRACTSDYPGFLFGLLFLAICVFVGGLRKSFSTVPDSMFTQYFFSYQFQFVGLIIINTTWLPGIFAASQKTEFLRVDALAQIFNGPMLYLLMGTFCLANVIWYEYKSYQVAQAFNKRMQESRRNARKLKSKTLTHSQSKLKPMSELKVKNLNKSQSISSLSPRDDGMSSGSASSAGSDSSKRNFLRYFHQAHTLIEMRVFFSSIYAIENLDFWLAVETFRECSSFSDQYLMAHVIVDHYIRRGSNFEINIRASLRDEIIENVGESKITPNLFDEAQGQVFKMLSGSLLNSSVFKESGNLVRSASIGGEVLTSSVSPRSDIESAGSDSAPVLTMDAIEMPNLAPE